MNDVIRLPAGTLHVRFDELARLIAEALCPNAETDDDDLSCALDQLEWENELPRAVKAGELTVRHPRTRRPHQLPHGQQLGKSLVSVDDLRDFLAESGIAVQVGEPARVLSLVRTEAPAAPAPAAVEPVKRHKAERRAKPLGAVLALARSRALDPDDWTAAWDALVALAQSPDRPAPLLGYAEGEGVKWQADDDAEPVRYLTRENLRDRWRRRSK